MKVVNFNEFEKLHFQDLNDAQKAIQSGVYDSFLQLFNNESGFLRSSFAPIRQSATTLRLSKGIAFFYDSSQTGFNTKYRPIILSDNLDLTIGSASWSAAPTAPNKRVDVIAIKPKLSVAAQSIRKVKSGGTGPIVNQLIDKSFEFTYEVKVIPGEPGLSPEAAPVPAGYMTVAEILVTGGSGIVSTADILDLRNILYAPSQNSVGVTTPGGYPFSLTKDMDGRTILVDTSSARTLTLPAPLSGLRFTIKDAKGLAEKNPITLARFGSEKIEGFQLNSTLETNWGSWTIVSNGVDWFFNAEPAKDDSLAIDKVSSDLRSVFQNITMRNWKLATNPAAHSNWNDIAWSPERKIFVAVATSSLIGTTAADNIIATSTDGLSWTLRSTPEFNVGLSAVTWASGIGLFVAVRSNSGTATSFSRVVTSPDGITWTARNVSSSSRYRALSYGRQIGTNGLLVAVSEGSSFSNNRVITSTDGITWTDRLVAGNPILLDVEWSPKLGTFVAVGANNYIITSKDGVTWTQASVAGFTSTYEIHSVCWSEELGKFIAIAWSTDFDDTAVLTSTNGTSWTENVGAPIFSDIVWSPALRLFIAPSLNTNHVFTSLDGLDWMSRAIPSAAAMKAVAWSKDLGLAVSVGGSVNNSQIITSL